MKTANEAGFTILEVVIVLAVLAMLAIFSLPALESIREARVEGSVEQARAVLQVCDIARKKALTSQIDAKGVTTHTYPAITDWSPTSTLQSKLERDYRLPDKNALGTQILVKFDAKRCYVAVDLPFLQDKYGGFETQTVSGKTRIIVSTRSVVSTSPSWVIQQKRFLHQEETR